MIRPSASSYQTAPQRRGKGALGAVLTGCIAVVLLALGGLWLLTRTPPHAGGKTQTQLGAVALAYDAAYARFEPERAGGRLEQIDLAANFPDFGPAGEVQSLPPSSDLLARQARTVFLTLTPAGAGLDPAERMEKLYQRFLDGEEWSHPGGLTMKRFAAGSPFANEDLYFTAPEGRLFAARCARPAASPDGLPDACLYEFRQNGVNALLRFAPARLADWEQLAQGARQFLARMQR
jgi:hypothetical protein